MGQLANPTTTATQRVLIADPDDDARLVYKSCFQGADIDVIEALDGRDALAKALVRVPHLLITETRLPYIDGYALCETLRRDSMTRFVPILVVTGETASQDLQRAHTVGADVVMRKPLRLEELRRETQRLLALSRTLRERSIMLRDAAARERLRSDELTERAARHVGGKAVVATDRPPLPPPALRCPRCDRWLVYARSYLGGVAHPEQWDSFECPGQCGKFRYRRRTRKLHQLT